MDKAPFGIIVDVQLKPGSTSDAATAFEQLVSQSCEHGQMAKFWAYSCGLGRAERFLAFSPFSKFSDLDRPSTGEILGQKMGSRADHLIKDLESLTQSTERSMVEYVPALSNPPSHDAEAPGPMIYHIKAKLKPGATLPARGIAAQIAEAYRGHDGAPKYWGYSTVQGDGNTVHIFMPMSGHGDLDNWPSTGQILAGAHGEAADEVLSSIDSMIESTERQVLHYVPSLSNAA